MATQLSAYIEDAANLARMTQSRAHTPYTVSHSDGLDDTVSDDSEFADMDDDLGTRACNPFQLATNTQASSSGNGRVMHSRVMRQVLTEQISCSGHAQVAPSMAVDAPGADGVVSQQQQQPAQMGLDQMQYCISPQRQRLIQLLGEPGEPSECYGCKYIRITEHTPPVDRVAITAIQQLVATSGSYNRIVLAREITSIHRQFVINKQPVGAPPVPEWRAIDVYDHYFTHYHARIDPQQSIDQSIRTIEQWQQELQDNGTHYTMPGVDLPGAAPRLDPKRLTAWIALDRHKMSLLKMDPSKSPIAGSCVTATQGMTRGDALCGRPTVGQLPSRWNTNGTRP